MKLIVTTLIALSLSFIATHASETMKGAKKDLETFKQEMSAKLDSVEKKLDEMKADAKTKGNKAHEKSVSELEATREKLRKEINDLSDTTGAKWKEVKKGIADSIDKLNTKVQEAMKK